MVCDQRDGGCDEGISREIVRIADYLEDSVGRLV